MSNSVWSKKTVAAIAVAAFVGALSPIAANAWDDNAGPDEIVQVTVDVGDGSDGGGGGGGNVCTGYGSITIPLSNIVATRERKSLKVSWAGDTVDNDNDSGTPSSNDDSDASTPDPRDLNTAAINPITENTRTNYISQNFTMAFDADSCESSDKSGYIWTERQPVEKYISSEENNGYGDWWKPVEMTWNDGVLSASQVKATSNLLVNYNLFGVNHNSTKLFDDIHWEGAPLSPENVSDWGTEFTNQDMPVIWGTDGEATAKAMITIYGDTPVGKFRTKYGFTLDVGSYNSGPWQCFFGGC